MGKKCKTIWMTTPLCLFWTLRRERNRVVFENGVTFSQRIKANFLSNLWTQANLYSFDNTNSLLDFFDLVREYVEYLGLFFGLIGFFAAFC